MFEEVKQTAVDLMRHVHGPDGTEAVLRFTTAFLDDRRIPWQMIQTPLGPVLEAEVGERGAPVVAVVVHGDVKPPSTPGQTTPRVAGRWLVGRGSGDMLAGYALALHTLADLRDLRGLRARLVAVFDEERNPPHSIQHYAAERGADIALAITLEPTANRIAVASMGALILDVTVTGKEAHSAYGEEGINAIRWASRFQLAADRIPCTGTPTRWFRGVVVEPVEVEGGAGSSVIPGSCSQTYTVRHPLEIPAEQVIAELRGAGERLVDEGLLTGELSPDRVLPRFTIDAAAGFPPVAVAEEHPAIHVLSRAVAHLHPDGQGLTCRRGTSDVALLGGVPGIELGPDGRGSHGPDERLDLESLAELTEALPGALRALAAVAGEIRQRWPVPGEPRRRGGLLFAPATGWMALALPDAEPVHAYLEPRASRLLDVLIDAAEPLTVPELQRRAGISRDRFTPTMRELERTLGPATDGLPILRRERDAYALALPGAGEVGGPGRHTR
jgi:succinyl-diaminopimelate desuccinylase